MDPRNKLTWIQRNRSRRVRTQRAGDAVAQVVAKLSGGPTVVEEWVVERLAGVVDEDFKHHCRLAGVQGHRLIVCVDEASLVYPMRVRWAGLLAGLLAAANARSAISSLVFQFGRSGRAVGPALQ